MQLWGILNVLFLILLFLGLTQVPQVQKTEIAFTASEPKTYEPYVRNLDNFLRDYSAEQQTENIVFQDCGGKSRLFPTAEGSEWCLCQVHQKLRVSSCGLSLQQFWQHVGKLAGSGFSDMAAH